MNYNISKSDDTANLDENPDFMSTCRRNLSRVCLSVLEALQSQQELQMVNIETLNIELTVELNLLWGAKRLLSICNGEMGQ